MGEFWFAVMTRANKEQLARDDLRRRGFEIFWPYISEWVGTGHKARSRLVKRSWLSRYLFVKTSRDELYGVNDGLGVSTIVRATNQEPYPIPDSIIQELQSKADHLGEVFIGAVSKKASKFSAAPGAILQFKENSALFGLRGELIRALENGKVLVMFKKQLFGSLGRAIEVNASDVEVISA